MTWLLGFTEWPPDAQGQKQWFKLSQNHDPLNNSSQFSMEISHHTHSSVTLSTSRMILPIRGYLSPGPGQQRRVPCFEASAYAPSEIISYVVLISRGAHLTVTVRHTARVLGITRVYLRKDLRTSLVKRGERVRPKIRSGDIDDRMAYSNRYMFI